jgi:hypothetical protein
VPRALALAWGIAGAAACVPERPLSSYQEPEPTGADVSTTRASSLPDASVDDAGVLVEPAVSSPSIDASPGVDASMSPSPTLICAEECVCESATFGEFMFCATAVSHEAAVAACSLAGGTLASIEDAEKNAWLTERMTALQADDFWLSGTDLEDEGLWRWSDGRVFFDASADAGTPRPYAAWGEEQPNDLNGEDCMRSSGAVWTDLDCSEQVAFVCQG